VQTENEKAVRDPMRNELEKLLHDYLDFNIETDGLAQRTREAIAALQSQVLNTDGWKVSGWIEFSGGECPVQPGTYVEVKQRRGNTTTAILAESMGWEWYKEPWNKDLDIVAYRIVGYTEAACQAMLSAAPQAPQQVSNTPQDGPAIWKALTQPGQVQVGDSLSFSVGNHAHTETVQLVLNPGTPEEEVIYNKSSNFYFITSMVLNGTSSHKNVMFLRTTPPQQQEQSREMCTCHRCIKEKDLRDESGLLPLSSTRMILCTSCGNKRCPHASDHTLACTGSNEPGQKGSVYTSPATPIATASQESAPGQEAVARMVHDFPALSEFYAKHALGPMTAPSCLCCGETTKVEDYAVRHAELPGIIICKICKSATERPTSTAIAAMVIHEATGMLRRLESEFVDIAEVAVGNRAIIPKCERAVKRIHDYLASLTPANAEAELEALMMKVANEAWKDGLWCGKKDDISGEPLPAIVRRVLDEKGE
jgi:hypothetical protein